MLKPKPPEKMIQTKLRMPGFLCCWATFCLALLATLLGTSPIVPVDNFTYTACVVPKLKTKKLKQAKRVLRNAGCKVGNVRKLKGATANTAKVLRQSPKPGRVLAPGASVDVKLGQ